MIREYGTDEEATRLMDNFNWYILPVFNPDGYDYTWTTVSAFKVNYLIWLINMAELKSPINLPLMTYKYECLYTWPL